MNILKENNAIEIKDMYKFFKVQYDKPNTLKEKLVSIRNNKIEHHEILNNINLEIKKGETVALVGTNGSGKSTLLKLMTKIIYPNQGTVTTSGKLTSLLELGAGFHPDFTGRENIYFNAAIFGLNKKEIDKRVDKIIEFSELGNFIDNPIRTYSSGMYMRLAFSVAINVDAEILLIDEILAVGDQHFQDKCFSKLEELRDSEKTIVIVTHSLEMIKKLCTRAIWIYKGKVEMDDKPENVITSYLERIVEDSEKNLSDLEPDKVDCFLQLDCPKQNENISVDTEDWYIHGWEVSNIKESVVEVYLDGKKIEIERMKRDDVLLTLQDGYGGATVNLYPGFTAVIDITKLVGKHELVVKVLYNEEVLREEKRSFNIVDRV